MFVVNFPPWVIGSFLFASIYFILNYYYLNDVHVHVCMYVLGCLCIGGQMHGCVCGSVCVLIFHFVWHGGLLYVATYIRLAGPWSSKDCPVSASHLTVGTMGLQTQLSGLDFWSFWGLRLKSSRLCGKYFIERIISPTCFISKYRDRNKDTLKCLLQTDSAPLSFQE